MIDYDGIAACAIAYRSAREAMAAHDTVTAAEDVLRARLQLVDCLTARGWTPPPGTEDALAGDRQILVEVLSAEERRTLGDFVPLALAESA